MSIPGSHIETIESKWSQSIDRMFDTPESRPLAPDAHIWPAFLYSGHSRTGVFRPPAGKTTGPHATALVHRSRWIARCPFPACISAQNISPNDPWFYCATCHNETAGHASVPLDFPTHHKEIEGVLLHRPNKENRNWLPDETLDDLKRENAERLA